MYQSHGTEDPLVEFAWGENSFGELRDRGIKGTFVPIEGMGHEMQQNQLAELMDWIETLFVV